MPHPTTNPQSVPAQAPSLNVPIITIISRHTSRLHSSRPLTSVLQIPSRPFPALSPVKTARCRRNLSSPPYLALPPSSHLPSPPALFPSGDLSEGSPLFATLIAYMTSTTMPVACSSIQVTPGFGQRTPRHIGNTGHFLTRLHLVLRITSTVVLSPVSNLSMLSSALPIQSGIKTTVGALVSEIHGAPSRAFWSGANKNGPQRKVSMTLKRPLSV